MWVCGCVYVLREQRDDDDDGGVCVYVMGVYVL